MIQGSTADTDSSTATAGCPRVSALMQLDPKAVLVHPAGHISQEWQVRVPAGTSFGDIFKPALWTGIEKVMRQRGPKRPRKDDLTARHRRTVSMSVPRRLRLRRLPTWILRRSETLPVAQVLDDLDALPRTSSSAELKKQANTLRKRWAAAGVTREDLSSARRAFAKTAHPDTNAVNGQRLAAANAILDAALASQEAA